MTGEEVKNTRLAAELSQEELAALINEGGTKMSQTMLSRIEQGERDAPAEMRALIRAAVRLHEAKRRQRLKAVALA